MWRAARELSNSFANAVIGLNPSLEGSGSGQAGSLHRIHQRCQPLNPHFQPIPGFDGNTYRHAAQDESPVTPALRYQSRS
jgi:hypothetical protein